MTIVQVGSGDHDEKFNATSTVLHCDDVQGAYALQVLIRKPQSV